MAIEVGFSV